LDPTIAKYLQQQQRYQMVLLGKWRNK